MCEPVTILAGVAAAGTVASGVSAHKAAKAQGKEAARQGKFNAQMAEYAALDAERRGREQAAVIMRQTDQIKGEQNNAAAASGVTAGYGTLAQAAAQTDFFAKLDVNTALDDATRDAWTARTQGAEAIRGAASAQKQAYRSANATILQTGTKLASQWYGAMGAGAGSSMTIDPQGYGMGASYGQSLPTRGGM